MSAPDYPQKNIVKNAVQNFNRGSQFKPAPPPASAKPKYGAEYERLISPPPAKPAPFPPSQSDHVEYVTFGGEVDENIYDPG